MKTIITILLFLSIPLSSQAQVNELLGEVNEFLVAEEYAEALPNLQILAKSGYVNANIDYKIGLCFLNSVRDRAKAIPFLERASKNTTPEYNLEDLQETRAPLKTILYLGDAYRVNYKIKEAQQAYKKYMAAVGDDAHEQAVTKKRIAECQMAEVFMKNPIDVKFKKLSKGINKGESNFSVCISGDGKSMVFNRKMKFYDAIFYSTRTDTTWSDPKEITSQLGVDGAFQPTGLSPDGKRLLLTSYNHLTGYDIYESLYKDGKWKAVKYLSTNSAYYDIDAVYGTDGKTIYFSSNREPGYGGFDIFKAPIDETGESGTAENLGNEINSAWDEKSPSFSKKGSLLIFSSQRKPSMGGYDFFYAQFGQNGKWGAVYNAGYPFSTSSDDLGLKANATDNSAVLAKYDPNSNAELEIFSIHFDALSSFRLVSVQGEIRLKGRETSLKELKLFFIDRAIEDTIGIIDAPESGQYSIDLYPGSFKLAMERNGALTHSQLFTIPSNNEAPYFQLISELGKPSESAVKSAPAVVADSIWVSDILFDFDKPTLSQAEIDNISRLVAKLKRMNIKKIELLGFADDVGDKNHNLKLSEQRANNAMKVFVEKGISKDLITAKGMGGIALATKNKTNDEAKRSINRRVEIRIASKDDNLKILKKEFTPQSNP